MNDQEKAALEARIDELCAEVERLRGQTELLVTLLRNDCDIEASWDGLRKFWYIGLTESGCLMRDRACKAEAENAKLRELCKTLYQLADESYVPFKGANPWMEEFGNAICAMRGLGIEVPE